MSGRKLLDPTTYVCVCVRASTICSITAGYMAKKSGVLNPKRKVIWLPSASEAYFVSIDSNCSMEFNQCHKLLIEEAMWRSDPPVYFCIMQHAKTCCNVNSIAQSPAASNTFQKKKMLSTPKLARIFDVVCTLHRLTICI